MMEKYPVIPEAEPFYYNGNRIGVLVQHGFTGTTQSMRQLGQAFAAHGYTVYGPRLKGHGTHYEDMDQTTYHDWLASAEEGYQKLRATCDDIFVAGLSMGGTIALHLALEHPEIKGIMLINAAIRMDALEEAILDTDARFLDAIGSDIKKAGVVELAYEKTPVSSVKGLLTLMENTRSRIGHITCPALILSSTEDHVVPPDNSRFIHQHLSSEDKEIVSLDHSYHVTTLDNDAEKIKQACTAFVHRLSHPKK